MNCLYTYPVAAPRDIWMVIAERDEVVLLPVVAFAKNFAGRYVPVVIYDGGFAGEEDFDNYIDIIYGDEFKPPSSLNVEIEVEQEFKCNVEENEEGFIFNVA